MLRIRVLGELALERDGDQLEVPAGQPAQLLLGWLALNPGSTSRSRIAGRFWPRTSERVARTNLRSALADLRRALGADSARYLSAPRDSIGLAESVEVSIDLADFERLLAAWEASSASRRSARRLSLPGN